MKIESIISLINTGKENKSLYESSSANLLELVECNDIPERIIKSVEELLKAENWEELKALSNHLSPGMHFYQLVVKTKDGKTAKKYGKIICLN